MIEVILGLGSNLDAQTHLSKALDSLKDLIEEQRISRWYESEALNKTCPNYLNLVVIGRTRLPLTELLSALKSMETQAGRGTVCTHCPLDIDLLTYGDLITEIDTLRIPRSDLIEHAHVLQPLAEIYPQGRHPSLGTQYAELWQQLSPKLLAEQRLWQIT